MGEKTVLVKNFKLLSKALKPLPLPKTDSEGNTYDEFNDPETRYRQRTDLAVNPHVKEVFVKRTKLFNAMREFLIVMVILKSKHRTTTHCWRCRSTPICDTPQ